MRLVEVSKKLNDVPWIFFICTYSPSSVSFSSLKDMTIAAACAPPGGGRNPVTPRFIRHFSMLCLPTPSEHSLKQIFKVRHMVALILNEHFSFKS